MAWKSRMPCSYEPLATMSYRSLKRCIFYNRCNALSTFSLGETTRACGKYSKSEISSPRKVLLLLSVVAACALGTSPCRFLFCSVTSLTWLLLCRVSASAVAVVVIMANRVAFSHFFATCHTHTLLSNQTTFVPCRCWVVLDEVLDGVQCS